MRRTDTVWDETEFRSDSEIFDETERNIYDKAVRCRGAGRYMYDDVRRDCYGTKR